MKRIIAFLLVALMVMSMAACSTKTEGGKETTGNNETTAAKVEEPASALEVLENTWAKYAEDEKFFAMGGFTNDGAAAADNAPGNVDMTTSDYLQYNLLVPADNVSMVTDCASIMHAMNANTFTCGVFHLVDGIAPEAFAVTMNEAIAGNMWMCGFPERQVIVAFPGGYVLTAFGVNDAMTPFFTHLQEAYPEANVLFDQPIA